MKNLFFSLAFLLIGSFAFANESVKNTKTVTVIENTFKTSTQKEEAMRRNSIHVTLSCGVEYDIENFTGTTTQLLNSVIAMNNSVCGTSINTLP